MKLADYIVDFVVKQGTTHIFTVTGGAIVHVTDAVGRREREQKDVQLIAVQHEQAGAMAAETYSRLSPTKGLGTVLVTSGPGATNLITGMCGCWFDSIPGLFISGQVNTAESRHSIKPKPRQVGFQETDIVPMVESITKYAIRVTDPLEIRYHLEKAVYLAKEGRPGPVLLDIPVNLQIVDIDPKKLKGFDPKKENLVKKPDLDSQEVINKKIEQTLKLIEKSERPVILLGGGVRIAGAEKEALNFAEELGFPVVVSWSGFDLVPYNHKQFVGHIGVYGSRGANIAIQNADLLISLGSRLDTRQTGGRVSTFARGAKKVMIEIDKHEIVKGRGLKIDVGIAAHVNDFFNAFKKHLPVKNKKDISSWMKRTQELKDKYPTLLPEYSKNKNLINAYPFLHLLSDAARENETIIADEGGNLVWTMQSWKIKKGQRMISTFGNSPMGYSFPAAMGASAALNFKPVICLDGDGGFQMNIQELQTVKHYNIPMKIFILNNRSMGIIKQFQDLYFNSRHYASSPDGGYSAPDFAKVAIAYGIPAISVKKPSEMKAAITKMMKHKGPILCDVWIDEFQKLNPKLEFGRPLEDMSTYLDREEFKKNMIIEPLPESKDIPVNKGWQTLK